MSLHGKGISQVRSFLSCPRKWWYWNDGHKEPPKWAFIGGSAMDEALNIYWSARLIGHEQPRETVLQNYLGLLNDQLEKQGSPPGESEYDDYVESGGRAITGYLKEYAPHRRVISVQKEIKGTIGGVPFRSFADLICANEAGEVIIADHKFVGQAPARDKNPAADSLQLHAYGKLEGIRQIEIVSLLKRKTAPYTMVHPHFCTDTDWSNLDLTFNQVDRAKRAGIATMADPGGFSGVCSKKMCGYWNICRGRVGGPLPVSCEGGSSNGS